MSIDDRRAPIIRFVVKHPWFSMSVAATFAMMTAALVVVSGVVPIKASSGHWALTAKFLDFAKTRSVVTHSWGIDAPPLDDDALVLRGAAHYEDGCFPCHGGPGGGVPPVMAAMTPPPPDLTDRVARWTPEQLFLIVKHGIKFTGMPGWPAQQRDDEVWAMVAFLRRMPKLDAAAYRRLAYGEHAFRPDAALHVATVSDPSPPAAVGEICGRCHGMNGTGRGDGAFPSLAGQRSAYLYASLRAFRDRTRFSGTMTEIASGLNDESMREIAGYYERLSAFAEATADKPAFAEATADKPPSIDAAADERGAMIATRGIPERDIPPCAECHGPATVPKNPAYPILAAQDARYLTSQLELLKAGRRGGSPNVNLMQVFVERIRPDEIRDVVAYYSSLAAPP